VAALLELRAKSQFMGPDDLVFASSNGTPLDEANLMRRLVNRPLLALWRRHIGFVDPPWTHYASQRTKQLAKNATA
jgi:hypothetical protein